MTQAFLAFSFLSKKRGHDEPFHILNGNESQVLKAIKNAGLKFTEGDRYLTSYW
jgi:hypothetical protein